MFQFFRRLLNHRIGIENPQQPENQNNMINMTQPQPESFIARDLRLRMERSRVNDALQLQATRERERNGVPIVQVINMLRGTEPIVPIRVQQHVNVPPVRRNHNTIYVPPNA